MVSFTVATGDVARDALFVEGWFQYTPGYSRDSGERKD
jgi:hypothetical protein